MLERVFRRFDRRVTNTAVHRAHRNLPRQGSRSPPRLASIARARNDDRDAFFVSSIGTMVKAKIRGRLLSMEELTKWRLLCAAQGSDDPHILNHISSIQLPAH